MGLGLRLVLVLLLLLLLAPGLSLEAGLNRSVF